MNNSKPFWQSKTVWVNTLTLLGTLLASLNNSLPAEYLPYLVFGSGLVNLVLRIFFTDSAVKFS